MKSHIWIYFCYHLCFELFPNKSQETTSRHISHQFLGPLQFCQRNSIMKWIFSKISKIPSMEKTPINGWKHPIVPSVFFFSQMKRLIGPFRLSALTFLSVLWSCTFVGRGSYARGLMPRSEVTRRAEKDAFNKQILGRFWTKRCHCVFFLCCLL